MSGAAKSYLSVQILSFLDAAPDSTLFESNLCEATDKKQKHTHHFWFPSSIPFADNYSRFGVLLEVSRSSLK